ncbi:MAG: ribosome maturation factor RimM [Terriglobales bacterium]
MTAAPSDDLNWVTLARLVKTQGRRGELAAEVLSDVPGRFDALRRVWLLGRQGERRELALSRTWPHQRWLVLAFAEIHDLSGAEPWVGALLQVPKAERAPAPPDHYFRDDLVGCLVYDGERLLGTLTEIEPVAGAPDLLHVADGRGGEVLIPFAADYIEALAVDRRQLRLRLPDGLVEINRAL